MLRLLGTLAGACLLLLGIPLTLSPVPLGLLMVAAGTLLLAASSPPFARWLTRRRARHDRVDEALDRAADLLPDKLAEPLEATDPKLGAPLRRMDEAERWTRR